MWLSNCANWNVNHAFTWRSDSNFCSESAPNYGDCARQGDGKTAPKPDKLWLGDRGVSQRLCLLKLQLGYTGPSPDKMIHAFQLATHLDQRRLWASGPGQIGQPWGVRAHPGIYHSKSEHGTDEPGPHQFHAILAEGAVRLERWKRGSPRRGKLRVRPIPPHKWNNSTGHFFLRQFHTREMPHSRRVAQHLFRCLAVRSGPKLRRAYVANYGKLRGLWSLVPKTSLSHSAALYAWMEKKDSLKPLPKLQERNWASLHRMQH